MIDTSGSKIQLTNNTTEEDRYAGNNYIQTDGAE
jgi:hypothetical protein